MAEENEPIDSTQPGPFQKYLFSGACYVQIGECYKTVKQLLSEGKRVSGDKELTAKLQSIWRGFVTQQPGEAFTPFFTSASQDIGRSNKAHENLYRHIQQAALLITEDFLNAIDNDHLDQIDVKQFFIRWASACDRAYQEIVLSEDFSLVFGELINAAISVHHVPDVTESSTPAER